MINTRGTQMLSTVDRWAGVIALHSMVCIFLLDLAPAFPLSNPAATDQSLEKRVNEYLAPYIDAGGFSGAILIARGGKVLLSRGYGMAITSVMTAQLARHLGASFTGHGGLSDAKRPSVEAGAQKALNTIPTLLAGGHVWIDAGLLAHPDGAG